MSLSPYLLRKVGWALLTILFVIVLNFFLFRVLPGDPARAGIRDPRLTAQAVEAIRVRYGLDKPVINCFQQLNPLELGDCLVNPLETQFFIYAGNLLRGELGISYHSNRPVWDVLLERLWNTVLLVIAGQVLAIVIGVALGVLASWKVRTGFDSSALVGSLVAWSLPTFWLGIILLFIGSRHFGLPIGGKTTPGMDFATPWAQMQDLLRHMILPTLTFTIVFIGEYMLCLYLPAYSQMVRLQPRVEHALQTLTQQGATQHNPDDAEAGRRQNPPGACAHGAAREGVVEHLAPSLAWSDRSGPGSSTCSR